MSGGFFISLFVIRCALSIVLVGLGIRIIREMGKQGKSRYDLS
jgi:hypothetical protein